MSAGGTSAGWVAEPSAAQPRPILRPAYTCVQQPAHRLDISQVLSLALTKSLVALHIGTGFSL